MGCCGHSKSRESRQNGRSSRRRQLKTKSTAERCPKCGTRIDADDCFCVRVRAHAPAASRMVRVDGVTSFGGATRSLACAIWLRSRRHGKKYTLPVRRKIAAGDAPAAWYLFNVDRVRRFFPPARLARDASRRQQLPMKCWFRARSATLSRAPESASATGDRIR